MRTEVKTVIIGSGISGLSFGHFLSKKDQDFLVLESGDRVGGIIHSKKKDQFICENGPNTVLLNNDAIIEIIKDCGLWEELQYPNEFSNKNRYVLHKGKLTRVPVSFLKFLFTPLLSVRGKCLIFRDLFVKAHSQNTTVYNFISARFGKEFHDQLIEPFITGVYAGNTRKMSTKHSLKLLWELEQNHGGVIKGFFRRNNKKQNLGSFNLPIGLSQLTEKMAEGLSQNVRLNCRVTGIIKNEDGYEIVTNSGRFFCQRLVSTIPAHALKKVILDRTFIRVLDQVNYSPVDVFHFGFKKQNIKNQEQGFGVLTKPSDHKKYLGVLFNSRTFSHVAPDGMELFTVLVGGERQKELCELPIEDLEQIVLSELEDLLDHKGEIALKNHFRWKKGIPQYDMNHQELVDAVVDFEKRNEAFYVLGNFHGGVSVSDCIEKSKKLVLNLSK
jgi:oxygen-dependent protoporphyrinogen oxidase